MLRLRWVSEKRNTCSLIGWNLLLTAYKLVLIAMFGKEMKDEGNILIDVNLKVRPLHFIFWYKLYNTQKSIIYPKLAHLMFQSVKFKEFKVSLYYVYLLLYFSTIWGDFDKRLAKSVGDGTMVDWSMLFQVFSCWFQTFKYHTKKRFYQLN